ncbi:hypothetical protein SLEP1_g15873 [Rubroshorea leprosula]|uniref:Uncharacterized protein n=1 Tax=Rubroshorea leprosula TaxID=152421 RepID=A0AAV5IZC7_9ROSI|nr:hypothetical protein SLEP1_g15873 [Rubroshorea leprosula]
MRAISMGIYMMATELKCRGTEFFLHVLGIVGLVAFAGLRVGLTLDFYRSTLDMAASQYVKIYNQIDYIIN